MKTRKQNLFSGVHVAFYAVIQYDKTNVGNHQIIQFDWVKLNIGNGYNSGTGIFTAPSSGFYVFFWSTTNKDYTYMNSELMVRGSIYGKTMSDAGEHDDYESASNMAIVQLSRGDLVWLRSGTWHDRHLAGEQFSTFSGFRL